MRVYCKYCSKLVQQDEHSDFIKDICQDCKKIIFARYKTQAERREIFDYCYNKHHNFMSPHVDYYYGNARVLCELSHGEDFNRKTFYGVTILKREPSGDWVKTYTGEAFFEPDALKKAKAFIKETKQQYT